MMQFFGPLASIPLAATQIEAVELVELTEFDLESLTVSVRFGSLSLTNTGYVSINFAVSQDFYTDIDPNATLGG